MVVLSAVYHLVRIRVQVPTHFLSPRHGGGDVELLGYALFFEQIASYGFIIAAPDSCDLGCTNPNKGKPYTDCAGLPPMTPDPTWNPWYGEAFKAIEVSC